MDLTYWESEVQTFRSAFSAEDVNEAQAVFLLRGLCYLPTLMLGEHPEWKTTVEVDFLACYEQAKTRMGDQWMRKHMLIISTHTDVALA